MKVNFVIAIAAIAMPFLLHAQHRGEITAQTLTVKAIAGGGKISYFKEFQLYGGSGNFLNADSATGYSEGPNDTRVYKLTNAYTTDSTGFKKPMFFSSATVSIPQTGPAIISTDSMRTSRTNLLSLNKPRNSIFNLHPNGLITYSCSGGDLYANGVDTGLQSGCLQGDKLTCHGNDLYVEQDSTSCN